MKPNLRAVEPNNVHSRDYARRKVREWRSNAERQSLPVTNTHDVHGAPLLDVDAVLDHLGHDKRLGRKA